MSTQKLDPAAVRIAIAVVVGGVTVILDSTIVAVALRQLATDLHADLPTVQWVSTGYLLALGVIIPTTGWLQARLGSKRLWMLALTVFLLGSVLCACAWDVTSLIGFRALQGIGGGVMMPLMMTMVRQAVTDSDSATRLLSLVALPAALGPVLGPVVGGLVLGAGSWRWIFLINVPLCLVGLLLAWRLLPSSPTSRGTRLDVVGLCLLSPALVALLWGLSRTSGEHGFLSAQVLIPLGLGTALLIAFVAWALRRGRAAIVDLLVLRSRPTWASSALLFITGFCLTGAVVMLPLYWQELRGTTALQAGLLLIPQGVGSLLSRTAVTWLMRRMSARWLAALGFALVGAATVPFALADASTSAVWLMAVLLVRGLGLGVMMVLMTVAYDGLPVSDVPHASIVTRISQQVGGSVAVALLTVILTGVARSSGSLAHGFDVTFWCTVGFSALAVALSFLLPGRRPTPRAREGAQGTTVPGGSGAPAGPAPAVG